MPLDMGHIQWFRKKLADHHYRGGSRSTYTHLSVFAMDFLLYINTYKVENRMKEFGSKEYDDMLSVYT